MLKLKNLTPHNVNLMNEEEQILAVWRRNVGNKEDLPRVSMTKTDLGGLCVENPQSGEAMMIPHFRLQPGEVENMPEPEPDVIFFVGAMIKSALPERTDLVSPGDSVRDDKGRVIGFLSLSY